MAILSQALSIITGVTDGSAAPAGIVGEVLLNNITTGGSSIYNNSATCTISIASPAVVTLANHGLAVGNAVNFTTSGALPTGITASQNYYIIPAGFTSGSFQFSATPYGSAVNTSGTQSGTQTANGWANQATSGTANAVTVAALQLTAGDWDLEAFIRSQISGNNTSSRLLISPTNNSFTFVTPSGRSVSQLAYPVQTSFNYENSVGPVRVNVSSATVYYAVMANDFTAGTSTGVATMVARRMR